MKTDTVTTDTSTTLETLNTNTEPQADSVRFIDPISQSSILAAIFATLQLFVGVNVNVLYYISISQSTTFFRLIASIIIAPAQNIFYIEYAMLLFNGIVSLGLALWSLKLLARGKSGRELTGYAFIVSSIGLVLVLIGPATINFLSHIGVLG